MIWIRLILRGAIAGIMWPLNAASRRRCAMTITAATAATEEMYSNEEIQIDKGKSFHPFIKGASLSHLSFIVLMV